MLIHFPPFWQGMLKHSSTSERKTHRIKFVEIMYVAVSNTSVSKENTRSLGHQMSSCKENGWTFGYHIPSPQWFPVYFSVQIHLYDHFIKFSTHLPPFWQAIGWQGLVAATTKRHFRYQFCLQRTYYYYNYYHYFILPTFL